MADNFPANPGVGGNTFASDEIAAVHYPRSKIGFGVDGAYADVSAAAPLPVVIGVGDAISAGNSSTAVLGVSAVFTGTGVDTLGYSSVSIGVIASHASATDGLSLQQSSDNTNWDNTDVYTVPATTGKVYIINPTLRYFRVVYTNGATLLTSLRLQVILRVNPFTRGSVQRPQDARTNDNDYDETITYPGMFNGTTWDRLRGDITNGLDVDVTRLPALVAGTATIGGVMVTPTTAAAQGVTPVASGAALVNGLVLKASAGNLYSINVFSSTAGFAILGNSTTVAGVTNANAIRVWAVGANGHIQEEFNPPLRGTTGLSVAFSSTPFPLITLGATAFVAGEAV